MKQTLKAWAKELRVDPATLEKRLRKAGFSIAPKKQWGARDIFIGWTGDKEVALTRQALAVAEKMERDNDLERKALIPVETVAGFIRDTFGPVREQALAMPAVMAGRVNPTDPQHARVQLQEWADGFLAHVREKVPAAPEPDGGDDE